MIVFFMSHIKSKTETKKCTMPPGFELPTLGMPDQCSATELSQLGQADGMKFYFRSLLQQITHKRYRSVIRIFDVHLREI